MESALVTGGAGFIGSHVAEALVNRGVRVRILDNLSTGYVDNFAPFREQVEFVNADVTNRDELIPALEGVDTVFHLAALASVPLSVENPLAVNRACTDGTLNLLDVAVKQGIRRLVYSALERLLRRQTNDGQPRRRYSRAIVALRRGQVGRRVLLPGFLQDLWPGDRGVTVF